MPTISHKNLSGSQLHELKGVAAATDNQVATASSAVTVWQKLTASHLTGTGNPFGGNLLQVQDVKATNVSGGASTATAWTKRPFSTTAVNDYSVTMASSVLPLVAGTYWAEGWMMACFSDLAQIRLRDTTSGTTLLVSSVILSSSAVNVNVPIYFRGRFALAGTKNVEFQYYFQTANANGLGAPYAGPGENAINADLCIWKIV